MTLLIVNWRAVAALAALAAFALSGSASDPAPFG
jgi:hypothetical protein